MFTLLSYSQSWNITIEVIDNSINVGQYSSLSIDQDNILHVSYYDADNNNLKYAYKNGGNWTIEVPDPTTGVGQYTSIAVDALGRKNISYYNSNNGSLMYAGWIDGNLFTKTIEIVDNTDNVGQFSSLSIDPSNQLHLSYYNATSNTLKYAFKSGGSWTIEDPDPNTGVGQYSSIAVDDLGRKNISYYNSNNGSLMYAGWIDGNLFTKTIEIVDNSGDVGQHSSLTIDYLNQLHVSYYDATNDDLKYAIRGENTWINTVVDNTDNVGQYSSIAVNDNTLGISYYDVTNTDLKFSSTEIYNPLSNSLVAHYPLNGNVNDESAYNNHGIEYGIQYTNDRFQNPNSACYFDGYDDYIKVLHSNILNFEDDFTISFWVKTSQTPLFESTIIMKYEGISLPRYYVNLNSEGKSNFSIYENWQDNSLVGTNQEINNGIFNHVVTIRRGNSMEIWINGVLDNTSISLETNLSNVGNVFIGRYLYNATGHYFNGILDDIRLYNRALNESEIIALSYEGTENLPVVENSYPPQQIVVDPLDIPYISVVFTNQMDISTINSSTFTITENGQPISGTIEQIDDYEYHFVPSNPLSFDKIYNCKLDALIKDQNGNPLDGNGNGVYEGPGTDDFNWSFTTSSTSMLCDQIWTTVFDGDDTYDIHIVSHQYVENIEQRPLKETLDDQNIKYIYGNL